MSWGIRRTRIFVLGVAMFVPAGAASGIFAERIWWLLLAVAVPTAVAILLQTRLVISRLLGSIVAVAASVTAVVLLSGGDDDDVITTFTSGFDTILSTEWPSPDRPDLVGVVALLLAIGTAIGAELARRDRWHLSPLLTVLISHIVVIALSAPLGVRLGWLVPLGLTFAVFATLRPDDAARHALSSEVRSAASVSPEARSAARLGGGLGERLTILRGERRLLPLILVVVVTAGAISLPLTLAVRADPRRNDPPEETAAILDPIEATLALRRLDPARPLYEVQSQGAIPDRWRTAALGNYDGQRWTPSLTLRQIGRRLSTAEADTIDYRLRFLDDDLTLIPLPGTPVTIDAPIETDPDRTIVRLTERASPSNPIAVTSTVSPTVASARLSSVGARPIDDNVSGLSEFATNLAGGGSIFEQLSELERVLAEDYALASNAPGGGLQAALIDRFLRDTQRGTAEQFATAYALLARALGVDARVATGFVSEATPDGDVLSLTSSDAAVWPEVRFVEIRVDGDSTQIIERWVAFDPVPEQEQTDEQPEPDDPAVQTPAAAQPPIAPPPEPSVDPQADDQDQDGPAASGLSTLGTWAVRVGSVATIVLLPVLLAIMTILAIKYRRRRHRMLAAAAAARVTGAWATATDRLVDAGLTIATSATNGDIARAGSPVSGGTARELAQLAAMSSEVTFGSPSQTERLAELAATNLEAVESAMKQDRTRVQRLRWQLSLRSLRRATRSPVV